MRGSEYFHASIWILFPIIKDQAHTTNMLLECIPWILHLKMTTAVNLTNWLVIYMSEALLLPEEMDCAFPYTDFKENNWIQQVQNHLELKY